jgi:hypothetical protein
MRFESIRVEKEGHMTFEGMRDLKPGAMTWETPASAAGGGLTQLSSEKHATFPGVGHLAMIRSPERFNHEVVEPWA